MRTAILDFDQNKLLSLRKKDKDGNDVVPDFADVLILQYLIEAQVWATEKAIKDNEQFFYIGYGDVINDLPILGISNPKVIGRRFDKLIFLGLLKKISVVGGSKKGTATYFALTDKVSSLKFTEEKDTTFVNVIKIRKQEPDKQTEFSFQDQESEVTQKYPREPKSTLGTQSEVTQKYPREPKSTLGTQSEVTQKCPREPKSTLGTQSEVTQKYPREPKSTLGNDSEFVNSEFTLSSSSSSLKNLNSTTTDTEELLNLLKESVTLVFGGLQYFSSDFVPRILESLKTENVDPKDFTPYLIWCLDSAKKSVKSPDKTFSYLYKICAEPSVIGNFKLFQKEKKAKEDPEYNCPACGTTHSYYSACPLCELQYQDRNDQEKIEIHKGLSKLSESEKQLINNEIGAITLKYDFSELLRNPALSKEQATLKREVYIKYGVLKNDTVPDIF